MKQEKTTEDKLKEEIWDLRDKYSRTKNFQPMIKLKSVRERLIDKKAQLKGFQQKRDEDIKIIEELEGLRLYRSKSCQLLLRRLKQELLNSLGEKNEY